MDVYGMKSKLFRSFMTFLLLLTVVFGNNIALAKDENVEDPKHIKVEIDEYKMIKQTQSMTDEQLQEIGYSPEDIQQLRSYDYVKALKERARLDRKTLKNLNYTDEQIDIFHNFTAKEEQLGSLSSSLSFTEEQLAALSSSMSFDGYLYEWSYTGATSTNKLIQKYNWTWTTAPLNLMEDVIGVGWTPPLLMDYQPSSDIFNTVFYKSAVTGYGTRNITHNFEMKDAAGAASDTFDIASFTQTGALIDWAYHGYGSMSLSYIGAMMTDGGAIVRYGHTFSAFSWEPTISIPWGTALKWTSGTQTEGEKYWRLSNSYNPITIK